MGNLPTKQENPTGLYQKYNLEKTDGTQIDPGAEYFILRLDDDCGDKPHLDACRAAVKAYADRIEKTYPKLSKDIRERYDV